MGEVYRARDSRLPRDAAIKVLPADLASDPDRLKRFEKEARSASALNHPNIVTVYDVGTSDGTSWIAMERVEGETLRKFLAGGPIPLRKLLGYATQIAEGLAKAHATGIVHRDLKPENVMVTKEGIVKILDFGLARRFERSLDATESEQAASSEHPKAENKLTSLPTVTGSLTEAGVVLGTVGYMSPEQALGQPLDFRSDQFSFGAILYEMASGKRAFSKASAPETLAAIIREEPAPLASAAPATPIPLRWIVDRCLAKDPEERYASTKDLARDLARVKDGVAEGSLSGVSIAAPAPRRFPRRGLVLTAAAAAAGLVIGVLATRRPPAAPPIYRPLTFHRGSIGGARFAPDGQTVVYAAAWQGGPVRLHTTRLDSTESTVLPLPSANLLSISRAGMLAIYVAREHPEPAVVAEVSLAGGAPRELVEVDEDYRLEFAASTADWAPGTDRLAVVRKGQLEFPVGKVLVPASGNDSVNSLRFSPDGRSIAYSVTRDGHFAIGIVDLAGKSRILSSGWDYIFSLAWHPVTGEIWFSGSGRIGKFGVVNLNAVTVAGVQRVVSRSPLLTIVEDIARDGRVLARSDDWPTTMMCIPPGASREVDLTWLDYSEVVDLSDDGRDLLFSEQGLGAGALGAIYLRKTDGASPAVRLGEGVGARALSPDKKWVLQVLPDRLVLLPVGPGESRTLQDSGLQYLRATWFPDGKRLLVYAAERGRRNRLYVRDLSGGPPRPLLPEGFRWGPLSCDGKLIASLDPSGRWVICPVEGGEPRPIPGLKPDGLVVRFDSTGQAVFVTASGPVLPLPIDRIDLVSGKRTPWKQIAVADPTGVTEIGEVRLTPDGRSYCYDFMRAISRLYVVEGLR